MTDFRLSKATRERSLRMAKGEPASPPLQVHPLVERILAGEKFTREELRDIQREQRQKRAMRIARCIQENDTCPYPGRCPHSKEAVHRILASVEEI